MLSIYDNTDAIPIDPFSEEYFDLMSQVDDTVYEAFFEASVERFGFDSVKTNEMRAQIYLHALPVAVAAVTYLSAKVLPDETDKADAVVTYYGDGNIPKSINSDYKREYIDYLHKTGAFKALDSFLPKGDLLDAPVTDALVNGATDNPKTPSRTQEEVDKQELEDAIANIRSIYLTGSTIFYLRACILAVTVRAEENIHFANICLMCVKQECYLTREQPRYHRWVEAEGTDGITAKCVKIVDAQGQSGVPQHDREYENYFYYVFNESTAKRFAILSQILLFFPTGDFEYYNKRNDLSGISTAYDLPALLERLFVKVVFPNAKNSHQNALYVLKPSGDPI